MNKLKSELQDEIKPDKIVNKVLTHRQIQSIKRELHDTILYEKNKKVSLKYGKNVNPEIDYDVLAYNLELVIDKALRLQERKLQKVLSSLAKAKKEIRYLEVLLQLAQEDSWDLKDTYREILEIDEDMAKWFKERWELKDE